MQPYTTEFTLSREYLAECYDESRPFSRKPNYLFPFLAGAAGLYLLNAAEQTKAAGILLTGLAVLELLHIRYRRAWWLFRQTIGKNANLQVTLTVDDNGIRTQSPASETQLEWSQIHRVIETERGLILVQGNGAQQYLSKALFPEALAEHIRTLRTDSNGDDA